MFGLQGLTRKVAIYMTIVAAGGLLSTTVGWGLLYWLFVSQGLIADDFPMEFKAVDYASLALSLVIGLATAIIAARSLTRRIVQPVTQIAEAARTITHGDLTARAVGGDRSLGEIADLVADFNQMAGRLEVSVAEANQWNATIAHELRTPLTVLNGLLQGAADGVFEKDDAWTAMLRAQVDGLTRLVEDLRVLSLEESGHFHLRLEVVNLASIIAPLRVLYDPVLTQSGLSPSWTIPDAEVVGDPSRIRQAAMALLENARIHAAPGPLKIAIDQSGDEALFIVADAGPGVPEEAANSIFAPFKRGRADGNGSGLGLAVVRSIARAHGGDATLGPSDLGGSRFAFSVPLASDGVNS
jgi:two-component system, OmpR family, sensor histidine kinase AdeS